MAYTSANVRTVPNEQSNVSEHIKHIFEEGELDKNSVVLKFRTTVADGKEYEVSHYNLDVIIAFGYQKGRWNNVNALKSIKLFEIIDEKAPILSNTSNIGKNWSIHKIFYSNQSVSILSNSCKIRKNCIAL